MSMDVQLRDGSTVEDPRLDRLVEFDEASRRFAAVDRLEVDTPRSWTWTVGVHLDQGTEGACVGFACAHEARAKPIRSLVSKSLRDLETFARKEIYWEAQKIDQWEGGSYPGAKKHYEGTSILAGVKIMQRLEIINEYRWAFGEDDLFLSVGHLGPAIIGVPWYEGMYKPNRHGYLEPTGRMTGGHAVLVYRVRVKTPWRENEWYEIWNSWGPSWGRRGSAKISREHMAQLLSRQGEACIPIVRKEAA